jgi:hypothetical protein
MASINLVVCVESIRTIISHTAEDGDTNQIFVPALVAVGAALGVKIVLFFYCLSYKKHSSQVEMLFQDHRNDLWINTFGMCCAVLSAHSSHDIHRYSHVCWREQASVVYVPVTYSSRRGTYTRSDIDPMGGFLVCLPLDLHFSSSSICFSQQIAFGVIIAWGRTIYHEFELLAGKSAPHEFLQLIIYKSVTFSDEIEKVDTVRAYHVSISFVVATRAHTDCALDWSSASL